MWHIQGRIKVHTWFWWGNMTETDHLENLGVYGRILEGILKERDRGMD
jgi:hypothetical protein